MILIDLTFRSNIKNTVTISFNPRPAVPSPTNIPLLGGGGTVRLPIQSR